MPLSFRALAAAALLTIAAPAGAIPVEVIGGSAAEAQELPDGRLRQTASGFVFPESLGELQAGDAAIYGAGDVSVSYFSPSAGETGVWMTVYVYPAAISLEEEAAEVSAALAERWTVSKVSDPAGLRVPDEAVSAWFEARSDKVSGLSGFVVAKRGDWFIKARATAPDSPARAAEVARMVEALNAIAWTWRGMTPARTASAR